MKEDQDRDFTKEKTVQSNAQVDNNATDPAEPIDQVNDDGSNVEVNLECESLRLQLTEANSRFLRLQADFNNFRRRTQKEKEELFQSANLELVSKLLPVMDSLEKAEEHEDSGAVQIFKQLKDILIKEGLEPIEAIGEQFDPNFHQAIDQAETDEYESGIVIDEVRKGYSFRGILIRPSMVRVAK